MIPVPRLQVFPVEDPDTVEERQAFLTFPVRIPDPQNPEASKYKWFPIN